MKQTIFSIIIIVAVVFGLVFIMNTQKPADETNMETQTELTVEVIQEGSGDVMLQPGQIAIVHYTGTFEDGVVFDSSLTRGQPFEFQYGTGNVILGWDQGLQNMKVGEKRKIVVPQSYGYGDSQVGPIPPNSTLLFEVELLAIQ